MSEIFFTLLSLSLAGTLTGLLLFGLKPWTRKRVSYRWQYYIWLVVLARLLLPFSPEINLINTFMQGSARFSTQDTMNLPTAAEIDTIRFSPATGENIWAQPTGELQTPDAPGENPLQGGGGFSLNRYRVLWGCGLVWLLVACLFLGGKVISYGLLVGQIKKNAMPCADPAVGQAAEQLCNQLRIRRMPPVYFHPFVPSPMMVGLFSQWLILPEGMNLDRDLRYVLHHELVHYRRQDIWYKWLGQLAVCVHWFNPFVRLVYREINRCCELSCDEAVIRREDATHRLAYGGAILAAVQPGKPLLYGPVSLFMSEDTKFIKERLDVIMAYGKGNKWAFMLTVFLTVTLVCSAAFAGSYEGKKVLVPAEAVVYGRDKTQDPAAVANIPDGSAGTSVHVAVERLIINAAGCAIEVYKGEENGISYELPQTIDKSQLSVSLEERDGQVLFDITGPVAAAASDGLSLAAAYEEAVRLYIPDKVYEGVEINCTAAPLTMGDIRGNVYFIGRQSPVTVKDNILNGRYTIDTDSTVKMETVYMLSDVTIENTTSAAGVDIIFKQQPENISFDIMDGLGPGEIPTPPAKMTTYGDGTPTLKIRCNGLASLTVDLSLDEETLPQEQDEGAEQEEAAEKTGDHENMVYRADAGGKVEIPIQADQIREGIMLLGQVPDIAKAEAITYYVQAANGERLFVGFSVENKLESNEAAWYNYISSSRVQGNWGQEGRLRVHYDSSYQGNYYLFLGTADGPAENITGTVVIQYKNEGSKEAVSLDSVVIKNDTWYLINNEQELRLLSLGALPLDGKYMLNSHIDLDPATDWIPVGTRETPFTGEFTGNGFEIRGLTIKNPPTQFIGMFGYAEEAKIYNVVLRDVNVNGPYPPGVTVGPVLAMGVRCSSHDNQILFTEE